MPVTVWFLYLDESGDLGFDFFGKKPTRFFTVAILALRDTGNNRHLINAVKKTIRRKLRQKTNAELKGSHTSFEVKRYFYSLVKPIRFGVYALTLNKRRVYEELTQKKDRVYNFIARQVLDQVPIEKASTRVQLVIDRSKNRREIGEFNSYIVRQLQAWLDPKVPLDIYHQRSHENLGIQAADLFSWGVFRKHEGEDVKWYDVFREKVLYDDRYL